MKQDRPHTVGWLPGREPRGEPAETLLRLLRFLRILERLVAVLILTDLFHAHLLVQRRLPRLKLRLLALVLLLEELALRLSDQRL